MLQTIREYHLHLYDDLPSACCILLLKDPLTKSDYGRFYVRYNVCRALYLSVMTTELIPFFNLSSFTLELDLRVLLVIQSAGDGVENLRVLRSSRPKLQGVLVDGGGARRRSGLC